MLEQILEDIEDLRVKKRRRGEFARCGRAGENENSGPYDRADAKSSQRPRAQGLLEPVFRLFGIRNEFVNGLLGKKLAGQTGLLTWVTG